MKYIGLRAILIAVLSVPFLGTSGAIIYHLVVDGTLAKEQPNPAITVTPVDVY